MAAIASNAVLTSRVIFKKVGVRLHANLRKLGRKRSHYSIFVFKASPTVIFFPSRKATM